MGCCDDTNKKFNCGKKQQSACVFYKKELPKYSELETGCASIEETTEELYKNQANILKSIDTKDLGKNCLDYPTVEIDDKDVILVKDVLKTLETQICNIMNADDNDDSLELDFKCLVSPCGSQINSLKDLLQTLINEICEIKDQLNN